MSNQDDIARAAALKRHNDRLRTILADGLRPEDKPEAVKISLTTRIKFTIAHRLVVGWTERNTNMSITSVVGYLKIAGAVIGAVIALLTGHYAEVAAGLVTVQAGLSAAGLIKAQDAKPGTDGAVKS